MNLDLDVNSKQSIRKELLAKRKYFNQALEIQRNMYENDYNLDIANTLICICSINANT